MGTKFRPGQKVTGIHFDGVGVVKRTRTEQGVTTVYVALPENSGVVTLDGVAGFDPSDLEKAGKGNG